MLTERKIFSAFSSAMFCETVNTCIFLLGLSNGKKFSVALLLSVFLGWLGIDRFYLGYPAIGKQTLGVIKVNEVYLFEPEIDYINLCND